MNCPICNEQIKNESIFCPVCGNKIPKCPSCGRVLYEKKRFCIYDGTELPAELFEVKEHIVKEHKVPAAEESEVEKVSEKKKKRSAFPKILLLMIILLFVGGAALYITGYLPQAVITKIDAILPVQVQNMLNKVRKNTNIPKDALLWKGHHYALLDGCDTWEEAATYCESLGGHLAVITSEEENEAIYEYMKENGYENAYIGLSDREEEGVWCWVNGEEVVYENWNELEPNGGVKEDYAMFFYVYEDGSWNDGFFTENMNDGGNMFLCEWDY